ncbi:S-layer homology domain-containing protein [Alkalibacillus aidingensis]|uniref:S-layer homology domain-containing protein n=1 Tax=Alkalibacillus aidingensis TaxID=2747607 RepID=UPI001660E7A5|nr:S-layer homology domain-containing protein [Alkalibacillus aidingensis]
MRKVVAIAVIILLTMLTQTLVQVSAEELSFSDMDGHWAQEEVEYLAEEEVIDGFDDGTFRPQETMTRGEFSKILSGLMGIDVDADVSSGDWSESHIHGLVERGIIDLTDDPDGFQANVDITRLEMSEMIAKALAHQSSNWSEALSSLEALDFMNLPFDDQEEIDEASQPYIALTNSSGIINGYSNGLFEPDGLATRAHVSVMLSRFLEATEQTPDLELLLNQYEGEKIIQDVSQDPLEDEEVAKEIPVLLYHHLLTDDENENKDNRMIVSVEQFKEQMALLHEHGYQTIKLEELYLFIREDIDLPENSVVITFDDGLKSNFEYAQPILEEYDFTAASYLITNRGKEKEEAFDPTYNQYFSWEEIEASQHVFEFGSHTHGYHNLNEGQSDFVTKSREEILEDLQISIDLIEEDFLTFSYPFGQYDERSLELLEELDFKLSFSTIEGKVIPGVNPLEIPRLFVYPETTIDQFQELVGI